jgi:hypothetical protein
MTQNTSPNYNYTMLRITLIVLTLLAAIFLIATNGNSYNKKNGMFIGTYPEYVNNFKRAADFSHDKFSKKVLFFMSNPAIATVEEKQATSIINSNLDVRKDIPINLILVKIVIGESNLDGIYKVIKPNTFMLLDANGKEVKRSNSVYDMDDVKQFIK